MADEPEKTPIQNLYAAQFANDLKANREEQGDITAQIAGLQQRLEQLRFEEELLCKLQGSLPGVAAAPSSHGADADGTPSAAAEEHSDAEDVPPGPIEATTDTPPTVPQPQPDGQAGTAPAKKAAPKAKAPAKKTAAKKTVSTKAAAKKVPAQATAAQQAPAKKAAVKKSAAKKPGEPVLGDLLKRILEKDGGPRTASELTTALQNEFPERARNANIVRNTLEHFVSKGRIERMKQGSTVYYHVPSQPAAGGSGSSPVSEPVDTPASARKESEPVPAQA